MGVCLRRFRLDMNLGWGIVCSELGEGTMGCSGGVFFRCDVCWVV